jgi:hypothetical protein
LSRFDLSDGVVCGLVGDDGGLEGVPVSVEGVDGRDAGGVGTADEEAGGCCVGGFGVVEVTFVQALSRLEGMFEWPVVTAVRVVEVAVDMTRSKVEDKLDSQNMSTAVVVSRKMYGSTRLQDASSLGMLRHDARQG